MRCGEFNQGQRTSSLKGARWIDLQSCTSGLFTESGISGEMASTFLQPSTSPETRTREAPSYRDKRHPSSPSNRSMDRETCYLVAQPISRSRRRLDFIPTEIQATGASGIGIIWRNGFFKAQGKHDVAKADPSFSKGIWIGRDADSGDHIIGISSGVTNSRSIRRLPPS